MPTEPESSPPAASRIEVRNIRFDFAEQSFEFDVSDGDFPLLMGGLGISLTMPYLEPYLIRTMKEAIRRIEDPLLAADARAFSQQEGHHFRNHAVFNERLRSHFGGDTAQELRAIEDALEADYRRFTRERSARFNLAYAEGFEAMTCSLALATAVQGAPMLPGAELWAWHMAEEIEHRSVAFDVYERLVGSYAYRILRGTWSQWHYLSYVDRFGRCIARALGRRIGLPRSPVIGEFFRRYRRTLVPGYDPGRIEVPEGVAALLEQVSARAASPSTPV